jgi:dolichyl-phosphate-mannose-protein mannosyltransferase
VKPLSSPFKAFLAVTTALILVQWQYAVLAAWSRQGFWLNYDGMEFPDLSEVYFVNYFLAFGIAELCLFGYAIAQTRLPEALGSLGERAGRWRYSILVLAAASFAAILVLKRTVLLDTVVTDDEYAFRFIADTLLQGRVINPLPQEPQFFQNQFIVLNDHGWFGKYPLGHPILLALGALAGIRDLIVPLVCVLLLVTTYWLGGKVYDRKTAFVGAVLLALSPQFLLTGGTDLSQPACSLFATLGLLALLRLEESGRVREAVACGLAFGYAVLVRPLPGVLYLPVAGMYLLGAVGGSWRRKLGYAVLAGLPVVLIGLGMLWINMLQTGSPLVTGYHANLKIDALVPVRASEFSAAYLGASLGSALMRQNVWQTGFPLVLLFALLARRSRPAWLLIGMVAAQLSYRFVSPKAGVMSTGPVYTFESMGWIALLVAAGARRSVDLLRGPIGQKAPRVVLSAVGGGFVVAVLGFWPVQVHSLRLGAAAHRVVYDLVERNGLHDAVVFYEVRLPRTWAHWLRNPKPDLTDDVLYLRKGSAASYSEMYDFAQKRFPRRSSWVLEMAPRVGLRLVQLRAMAVLERGGGISD